MFVLNILRLIQFFGNETNVTYQFDYKTEQKRIQDFAGRVPKMKINKIGRGGEGKLGKLDYVLKPNQMNILKEKFASNCLNLVVDNSAVSSLKIVITIEKNIMLLTRSLQDPHPG